MHEEVSIFVAILAASWAAGLDGGRQRYCRRDSGRVEKPASYPLEPRLRLRGGWGEVVQGAVGNFDVEDDSGGIMGHGWGDHHDQMGEDSIKQAEKDTKKGWEREGSSIQEGRHNLESPRHPERSDMREAGKLRKRQARKRDKEAMRIMDGRGEEGHLRPVGRGKATVVKFGEDILTWAAWKNRESELRDQSANSKQSDAGSTDSKKNATIPLTKDELMTMSKKELLRTARKYGLEIDGGIGLTNRQVREIVLPHLVGETRKKAKAQSKVKSIKSRYGASVWKDGEERSVYGPGGPTDNDFETMAARDISEMEDQQISAGKGRFSKKDREDRLNRRAQEYSDTYFRLVLTGELTVGSNTTYEENQDDDGYSLGGLPTAVDGKSEIAVASVNSRSYSKWIAADHRDFSHYSTYELNEKMMEAAKTGSVAGVEAIARAGGHVNSVGKLARGWTPLFSASLMGHPNTVEALCNLGANISAVTEGRNKVLHVVGGTTGCVNSTKVLIAFGAEVDARNDAGWTPLHCAARMGNMGVAEILCKSGADIWTRTGLNLTASEVAFQSGLEKTGKALQALEEAILCGSFIIENVVLRKPDNVQQKEHACLAEDETSESAEEIRRNAPKVYISSDDDYLQSPDFSNL